MFGFYISKIQDNEGGYQPPAVVMTVQQKCADESHVYHHDGQEA